jgi:hypothetical protein
MERLGVSVFQPLTKVLTQRPDLRGVLNPAFPYPSTVRLGFLKRGLAIEFQAPSSQESEVQIQIAPDMSLMQFLDIDNYGITGPLMYYGKPLSNASCFLGKSVTRLNEFNYDYASTSEVVILNGYDDLEQSPENSHWSNVTVFWTDATTQQLSVRHVDLLLFFPMDDKSQQVAIDLSAVLTLILDLPTPAFDTDLHHDLNTFIELLHMSETDEPTITRFLENKPAILQLALGCRDLHPQTRLKWQYQTDIPNLIPDFMPERMDGFVDILDFKLQTLKSAPTVGPPQRRHPSFEVNQAIAQLEHYDLWCSQEVNRRWLLLNEGIKVLHPHRYIIMGRTSTFPAEERQRIRQQRNVTVYTYDELIDFARHQLYRFH